MHEILHLLLHSLYHALVDTLRLAPFLFLTYLLMELIEHRASGRLNGIIARSGKVGPLVGGILGGFPQCGFSGAIAGLYSGGVITVGTLFAVFLATSDEMLPVMISSQFPARSIILILSVKISVAILAGFAIDLIFRKKRKIKIESLCKSERCGCESGPVRSAVRHTLGVLLFILTIGFSLEVALSILGTDALNRLFFSMPVVSNLLSALVGLIPNCASSVVITELYLEGVISAGCMMSGLFTGAGVGTLVLFKTNKNLKENLFIALSLWGLGGVLGAFLDLLGFAL